MNPKKALSQKEAHSLIEPDGDKQKKLLKQLLPKWKANAIANYQFARCGRSLYELTNLKNRVSFAIVTGSGPTLDDFIDSCKELYPKIIKGEQILLPIMSSTSSLNPLIANNIFPGMVIAYDASPFLIEHFKYLRTDLHTLVAPTTIHPSVLHTWEGQVYFFNLYQHNHPFFTDFLPNLYPNFPGVTNSGCVSNLSVRMALRMFNFEKVFLAGVDNGYPKDRIWCKKYFLCRFTNKWKIEPENNYYFKYADYELKGVKTRREFIMYRECLYTIMKEFPNKIFNLTPGGINTKVPIAQISDSNIQPV